ncbi:hypothetical protein F5B21DRAFT_526497 [Xylaria acuta]|nr:hypothetical protein F5B21DRAFT_526497 [Xylaria acuta]
MLRLIDVDELLGNYEIKFVYIENGPADPKYAIVSCMRGWPDVDGDWAHEADDFTYEKCCLFQYRQYMQPTEEIAFQKLWNAARCAKELRCNYIWIDYCCVGPEDLADSINFRYRWCQAAEVCLVYLPDSRVGGSSSERMYSQTMNFPCRWWLQSWTVPTILGSRKLNFYDINWDLIDTFRRKRSTNSAPSGDFEMEIQEITRIAPGALFGTVPLSNYSVATRISWAGGPIGYEREEDLAYSLVGIFGVYLAPIYGEEGRAAFCRLVAEVMMLTSDLSILAWDNTQDCSEDGFCGALPRFDDWPASYGDVPHMPSEYPVLITDRGVHVTALLYPVTLPQGEAYFMCLKDNKKMGKSIGIHLQQLNYDTFQRIGGELIKLDIAKLRKPFLSAFYIAY